MIQKFKWINNFSQDRLGRCIIKIDSYKQRIEISKNEFKTGLKLFLRLISRDFKY